MTGTFSSFDDTSASEIPADASHVAYYADSQFANLIAVRRQCPHAKVMPILAQAGLIPPLKQLVGWEHGVEIDVENTDWTVAMSPRFVHSCLAAGVPARIYVSLSQVPLLVDALSAAGIPRDRYMIRSANWDGVPHIDPGVEATQYTNHAMGHPLDESLNEARYWATPAGGPSFRGTGRVAVRGDLSTGRWEGIHPPGAPHPSYHGTGEVAVEGDLDAGSWHGIPPR